MSGSFQVVDMAPFNSFGPPSLNEPLLLIGLAALGVVGHVAWFNRGEHHLYSTLYFQLFIVVLVISTFVTAYYNDCATTEALRQSSKWFTSFFAGLYSSLLIYRVFLHRLNKFPGPLGSRASSFWLSPSYSRIGPYQKVAHLHKTYGDFVRIGPNDLSITHPQATAAVHGLGSPCHKGAFYNSTKPMVSLQSTRDRKEHDQRRRVWSAAFSDQALRGYDIRIRGYRDKLIKRLDEFSGAPVNITKWFMLYNFDVMGDLAFGSSFDMLQTSQEHWAVSLLSEGMDPLKFLFPTWFFLFMVSIPMLARDWWRFIGYCISRFEQRLNSHVQIPDIMSALIAPLKGSKPVGRELAMFHGDSQLIVVAGSDTTAATMTHVFLELARQPHHIEKIRNETAGCFDQTGHAEHSQIANCDHLNAVIWEALRLHPPVPTYLVRLTPKEGMIIGDTFVPGDVTVICPQYAIGRSESIYPQAEAFLPERWYKYPEMVKEKKAWAPFSIGIYGCIGKPLALMNLRTTLAELLHRYDVTFAPGEDGINVDKNSVERFTLAPAALNMCLRPRFEGCHQQAA